MSVALIPVKRLTESKSRLLPHLPDAKRQALTLAMLEDLIECLTNTKGLDRIGVTTPDETVAEHARKAGAEILMRPEPGLNAALEEGIARMRPRADEAMMIVLGDVAGAVPTDFEALLGDAATQRERGIWLAPSSDGGTSALVQRPPGVIPCCFGRDSADRHHAAAREARVPFHSIPLRSLAIDLDQPEDLDAFRATEGGGARTRALLAEILGEFDAPSGLT
ncbi:MAG: 2-phospho-L-lactate guanylyltransferase [Myxococcota bacterium]